MLDALQVFTSEAFVGRGSVRDCVLSWIGRGVWALADGIVAPMDDSAVRSRGSMRINPGYAVLTAARILGSVRRIATPLLWGNTRCKAGIQSRWMVDWVRAEIPG